MLVAAAVAEVVLDATDAAAAVVVALVLVVSVVDAGTVVATVVDGIGAVDDATGEL